MTTQPRTSNGLPIWAPLVGLLIAFAFAILVGIRICPTLTGLLFPPELQLPSGAPVTQIQPTTSTGTGEEERVYGTTLSGCAIARFYKDVLGTCFYDPDMQCTATSFGPAQAAPDGIFFPVAVCKGVKATGDYRVNWTVRIDSGYLGDNPTIFRVIREVTN